MGGTDQAERGAPSGLDRAFQISVLAKGLDGLVELVGAVLLAVVPVDALQSLAVRVTAHELSLDSHDLVATHLLRAANDLPRTRTFGVIYLAAHGVVKIVLVAGLLRRQRWAYPATLVFLGVFIAYQLYRIVIDPTLGMIALTAFDALVLGLVWREYRRAPVPTAAAA